MKDRLLPLDESDFQALLNELYGDGSWWKRFGDKAALQQKLPTVLAMLPSKWDAEDPNFDFDDEASVAVATHLVEADLAKYRSPPTFIYLRWDGSRMKDYLLGQSTLPDVHFA